MESDKLAISVSNMADLLSISRPTAYAIIARSDFDAVLHVGRRTLISRSRLEAWIERQCGGGDEDGEN